MKKKEGDKDSQTTNPGSGKNYCGRGRRGGASDGVKINPSLV